MKTTLEKPAISLDLPVPGEAVTAPHYALRVSAPEAALVAVSIDGGGWLPCRFAAGFWWYEWSGYAPGRHVIGVQSRGVDGAVRAQASRPVSVRPAGRDEEAPETD